jgi:hypothetical protein
MAGTSVKEAVWGRHDPPQITNFGKLNHAVVEAVDGIVPEHPL